MQACGAMQRDRILPVVLPVVLSSGACSWAGKAAGIVKLPASTSAAGAAHFCEAFAAVQMT